MASSDHRAGQIFGCRPFLALLGLLFATSISACTQTTTSGGLAGIVTDPSKAVVPDADVKIEDKAKGTTQSTKTDQQGVYRFFFVAPGRYTLSVSNPGFREENQDVNVLLGPPGTRNITLAIAGEASTVNVTAEVPLLQAENGDVSTTMNLTHSSPPIMYGRPMPTVRAPSAGNSQSG
jgi:Carboxypeptidase regulatory-like domain